MSEMIRVYVNEQAVEVTAGARASAAVAVHNPELAEKIAAGGAYITDGRGIRLESETLLGPGAILRVIVSARTVRDTDA